MWGVRVTLGCGSGFGKCLALVTFFQANHHTNNQLQFIMQLVVPIKFDFFLKNAVKYLICIIFASIAITTQIF